jgi:two-component system, LytTR family, response regulator
MSSMSPTCLVVTETSVDGEQICRAIENDEGMQFLGLWKGCETAEELIATLRPDILFLGVDLQSECGFDLLDQMDNQPKPMVVFVSANRAHAVRAFGYHPLDFLSSPVDEARLRDSLDCAKLLFRQEADASTLDHLEDLPEAPIANQSAMRRLMVKSSGRILFIRPEEIDWVAAERDYVCIYNAGKKHLIREKISEMERNLPNNRFLRIHRSTIVNIERIRELHPMCYGEYAVVLNDGTRLVMSRSYRGRVLNRLTTAA